MLPLKMGLSLAGCNQEGKKHATRCQIPLEISG